MNQQTSHKRGALSWTTYELERAMQASALTPFEFDLRKNMIYRSPLCENVLGYLPDPLDISLDQAMSEIFPDDRETVSAAIAKAIENHSRFEVEWRQLNEGGNVRWVCMKGEPYFNDKNEPDRICATVQDIDARKVAEEQLAKRTQELDQANMNLMVRTEELAVANHKLKAFSAIAAHDLKGPLNSISMAAEIIAEDNGSSRYTELIFNASKRMAALIDNLLMFAKLERNEKPELSEVNLDAVLDIALENLSHAIAAKGAIINRKNSLPVVRGNPTLTLQLFQNIIGNALKFVNEGRSPEIDVSAIDKSGAWEISIQDNGKGIEPSALEDIFLPFTRSNAEVFEGTGLGLAICQKIMEAHGGKISVESKLKVGSRFVFTFPKDRLI